MQAGKILAADHQGTFVIKLVGDVRLTLCTTIDDYFDTMFSCANFVGVIIDLSEVVGIDSTSLGLLAKLAVRAKQKYQLVPIILCPNPDILRLLESMGFRQVFDIREHLELTNEELDELDVKSADEASIRSKIIEAHRILMNLNQKNRETFASLMTTLETR
ncbi:MAG: STAS domain-containing protein [Oceanicoccus sp.]